MTIDWTHFTPWASLAGGVLIGAAAAMLILLSGRVAGVSSILGGALAGRRADAVWRVAFLAGLLAAPVAYAFFASPIVPRIDAGFGALALAGFLVGLGTSYGSGCTSGHGVCGLARLQPRSLVATLAFMASGALTVFVVHHLWR